MRTIRKESDEFLTLVGDGPSSAGGTQAPRAHMKVTLFGRDHGDARRHGD